MNQGVNSLDECPMINGYRKKEAKKTLKINIWRHGMAAGTALYPFCEPANPVE